MRALSWTVVAALGLGVMVTAYMTRAQVDPDAPWASGIIAIGPELPVNLANVGHASRRRLRFLPAIERTETVLKVMTQVAKEKGAALEFQLRPKLIMLPFDTAAIDARALQSGRLPDSNADQVLAGATAVHHDRVTAGDRSLEVVGVLRPEFALVRHDYLIPQSDHAASLFPDGDKSVHATTIVRLTPAQARDRHVMEALEKSLPSPKYSVLTTPDRLEPASYYVYLLGLAIFLLGGSGALIGLYRGLAAWARGPATGDDAAFGELAEPVSHRKGPGWWATPLFEIEKRPRLVWGVHLAYFGLVIVGSVLIFNFPDMQTVLLSQVRDALSAPSGPLASAARAYATGSIIRAAAVTFVVNFFLGSLLMLTLPSIIVPGSGIFMAGLRSLVWGLLLAPTLTALAYGMLPHSGTMLLEGEGYILAALFGLLVPIHIFQSSLGGTPLSRFGRVLLLNVQANLWVAIVLAVAACYEATEVILMNR